MHVCRKGAGTPCSPVVWANLARFKSVIKSEEMIAIDQWFEFGQGAVVDQGFESGQRVTLVASAYRDAADQLFESLNWINGSEFRKEDACDTGAPRYRVAN